MLRDQRFIPVMAKDAFEESKHPRDHGKFSAGGESSSGSSDRPKPRASGVEAAEVIDLKSRGLKPKSRGNGASAQEAVQVAWYTAKRDGKNVTVQPTGWGWKVLKDADNVPHGQSHITVTPDGKMHGFKPPTRGL